MYEFSTQQNHNVCTQSFIFVASFLIIYCGNFHIQQNKIICTEATPDYAITANSVSRYKNFRADLHLFNYPTSKGVY